MKAILIGLLAAGSLGILSGCATPAYSGGLPTLRVPDEKATGENMNNIMRAWVLDSRMLVDDINTAFLLDEPSQLSKWHIR